MGKRDVEFDAGFELVYRGPFHADDVEHVVSMRVNNQLRTFFQQRDPTSVGARAEEFREFDEAEY